MSGVTAASANFSMITAAVGQPCGFIFHVSRQGLTDGQSLERQIKSRGTCGIYVGQVQVKHSRERLTFAAHHMVEGLLPFLHFGRSRLP